MSTSIMSTPGAKVPGSQRAPSVHDGLAITGFILAWLGPLTVVGLILSWVSVSTSHRDGRRASGLAVAGLIISSLAIVVTIIVIVAVAASQPDATQQYINCLNQQINNPALVCNPPG